MGGIYNRHLVLERFRQRVIEFDLMTKCPKDVLELLELKE